MYGWNEDYHNLYFDDTEKNPAGKQGCISKPIQGVSSRTQAAGECLKDASRAKWQCGAAIALYQGYGWGKTTFILRWRRNSQLSVEYHGQWALGTLVEILWKETGMVHDATPPETFL